uniref:Uncharacterized protein n=1 Tax=Zea mays TaxID=4577 RepID=A0A804N6K1_MAIZE
MLPSTVGGRGRYLMLGIALALAALLALASASESDHKVRAHDSHAASPCHGSKSQLAPIPVNLSNRAGSGPPRRSDLALLGWWRRPLSRGCSNVKFGWGLGADATREFLVFDSRGRV